MLACLGNWTAHFLWLGDSVRNFRVNIPIMLYALMLVSVVQVGYDLYLVYLREMRNRLLFNESGQGIFEVWHRLLFNESERQGIFEV